jgi:hypothetical protein
MKLEELFKFLKHLGFEYISYPTSNGLYEFICKDFKNASWFNNLLAKFNNKGVRETIELDVLEDVDGFTFFIFFDGLRLEFNESDFRLKFSSELRDYNLCSIGI